MPPPAGIDFTAYEKLRLGIHYEGPEAQPQMRLFLRNFDASYSKTGDSTSLKVNEINFDPTQHQQPLEMLMSHFTVASWWSSSRQVPIEKSGVEFNNISTIEISTGGNVVAGKHLIVIDSLEFEGKMLTASQLRLILLGAWMLAVVLYLLIDLLPLRRGGILAKRRRLSLKKVNDSQHTQNKTFEKLAYHDPLTDVLNRNGLAQELSNLSDRLDTRFFPLSLIFFDVDHFKEINDQHGHSAGDQVLREIASVIKNHIQRDDLLARWGGEEFLLICPHTQRHEAVLIANRLREIVFDHEWPLGLHVTGSFGVAEVAPDEDFTVGIERADKAMYRAKQNGRNRVEEEAE